MALVKIQVRRDTAANWTLANPVLAAGEPGAETDTGSIKIGDGIRNWTSLPYVAGVTLGSSAPPTIGSASAGVSLSAARSDHSHALPANISATTLTSTGNASVGGSLTVAGSLLGGSHKHTAEDINNFAAAVFAQLAASVKAGTNVTAEVDPAALTITLSSKGGGSIPLSVTTQPVDAVAQNGAATFTAAAVGGAVAVTYQWQSSSDNGATWASIPNAVGGTLSLTSLTPDQNNTLYRMRAVSGEEEVFSQAAKLVTSGLILTAQPPDVTVRVSRLVELTVAADAGGGAIAYQWQTRTSSTAEWSNVPAATQASYSFTASTVTTTPVQYRVAVTALGQTLHSRTALVTVTNAAFAVSDQPDDAADTAGTSTFRVSVSGGREPIAFQWQRLNGDSSSWQPTDSMADITSAAAGVSGFDTDTLTITGLDATQHLRRYRAVATDSDDAVVYSTIATLWTLSLKITQNPSNFTIDSGATAPAAAFTAAATADGGVTYQWQSAAANSDSWTNISGATSASYGGFVAALVDDGKKFRCVVTGDGQAIPTASAALIVKAAPFTITTQPAPATASGGAASFSFSYSGGPAGTPTIAWEYADTAGGWIKIPGASSTTLSVTGLTPAQNGRQYRAIVSNGAASAFTTASVVTVPGVILFRQPADVTVPAGGSVTFAIDFTTAACPAPAIQWQGSPDSGATWNNLSGQTAKTLTFTTSVSQDGDEFRAVITCSGQQTISDAATLTVPPPPLTFTSHPQSVTATTGTASFTFAVTGGPAWPQTIQWEISAPGDTWRQADNGDQPTLTVIGLTADMSGTQYRVRVIRTEGQQTVSAVSNAATLTVPGATITLHPVAASAVRGRATFTMDYQHNGCPDGGVEWQTAAQNDTAWFPIASASSKTLTVNNLLPSDSGRQYRAAVWCGDVVSYTGAAQVTVPSYEFFLSQPADVNAREGQTVTLSFTSDILSLFPSSWESKRFGQPDSEWTPFAGEATTSTSVRFKVSAPVHNNTQYRAVISVGEQKVYTRVATVTVGRTTSSVSVPTVTGAGLIGVAYGKGAFITISTDATVLARRSTDGGITWANNFLPATKTWDAIVSTGAGDIVAIASATQRYTGNWRLRAGAVAGPAGALGTSGATNINCEGMSPIIEVSGAMIARSTNGGQTWSTVVPSFQMGSFVRAWPVRWPNDNTIVAFYRGPATPSQAGVPMSPPPNDANPIYPRTPEWLVFRNAAGRAYKPANGAVVSYRDLELPGFVLVEPRWDAVFRAPFDIEGDIGPLMVAVSTDGGVSWSSFPVTGMDAFPQQIAMSPSGVLVAVTGKGTYYNNVPANGNKWGSFRMSATSSTGFVRERIVKVPNRRVVSRYPWRPSANPTFRQPTETTKTINEPITSHDCNVVAWVPGKGFIAGCDKYAVTMISQDGINWGGAASSRIIGEVPIHVVDSTVYAVDTEISGYEKIVSGESAVYPELVSSKLGVLGLTDAVNCWAHSPKEILLLQTGNSLTYIPRDDVPASPPGTPSQPLSLVAAPGLSSATLTWAAPFSAGTSAITDYLIEYSTDGGRTFQSVSRPASTATSHSIAGLQNFVQHVFRVSARNSSGLGAHSAYSTVITPSPLRPGAPTGVVATPVGPLVRGLNSQFSISWLPPADNGGSPITGYTIQSSDGTVTYGSVAGSVTTFTTNTTWRLPGTSRWSFRAIATNAIGNSAPSAATPPRTLRP